MPELFFNPEWKDSGGPTPLSWRFGEHRRWHPTLDFLYEVRVHGKVAWGPCLRFADADVITEVRPAHQNRKRLQKHTCDYCRTQDTVQAPTEQNKS